jgi:hypothetical protein
MNTIVMPTDRCENFKTVPSKQCINEATTTVQPLPVNRYGKKTRYCQEHAMQAVSTYIEYFIDVKVIHDKVKHGEV